MARKEMFTPQEVIDALEQAEGFVSRAARELGCTPAALYNYQRKYPEVAEAWEALKDRRLDFGEAALFRKIQQGHAPSIIFFLKTQGKERGWIESNYSYLQHKVESTVMQKQQERTPEEDAQYVMEVMNELEKLLEAPEDI